MFCLLRFLGSSNASDITEEHIFHKTEDSAIEFWFRMRSQLQRVKDVAPRNQQARKNVNVLMDEASEYQRLAEISRIP